MKYFIFILNIVFTQLSLELIGTDFDKPIFVSSNEQFPKEIFVVEQAGIVWKLDLSKKLQEIFLDITDRVHKPLFPGDEMGLLGFAFDPNFDKNKLIYLSYNDKNDNSIISKFLVKDNVPDKNSESILLKFKQPYSNHNGGHIAFGPDDNLYISIGDGGSAGDPQGRAQDLSNFFGSILRITPNVNEGYDIPIDNPFINEPHLKKEIWAYGLRNVWRFSFDRFNGDMFLGDVGQNSWEEINYIKKNSKSGINFGWNEMEASSCYKKDCDSLKYMLPIFEYPNDARYVKTLLGIKHKDVHGCSVTGGYVYRGKQISDLYGRYFFGDYCTGKVWSFIVEHNKQIDLKDHTKNLLESIKKKKFYLSSFGETNEGELILVDYGGSIYKLTN